MFDIKEIRENPEDFDAGLARRGVQPMAATILKMDEEARAVTIEMNDAQSRRNAASKAIGAAKAKGDDAEFNRLRGEVDEIKANLPKLELKEKNLRDAITAELSKLPNGPASDVPEGLSEEDNVELRRWGTPREIKDAKQHFEIGEALGGMDFETAAMMSGARFVLLRGEIARLERALGNFMIDMHTNEFGYTEINPPLLVRDEAMYGVGQLPKFTQDAFIAGDVVKRADLLDDALEGIDGFYASAPDGPDRLNSAIKSALEEAKTKEQFWLIPTSEAALTNIVREKILSSEELPLRFTALTPCFRSEAGSAGRDTRGMIRVHQFMKVEMVSITSPEQSNDEHERMTGCAEEILKRLDLPFRTMVLSAGDMGFSARKTYDLEVWLPGQEQYREISSCSNCGPFQARRMKARFKREGEKQAQSVHTLNGSGLAVGRALVAVLENYQNANGSVTIPEVLRSYMGGASKIG